MARTEEQMDERDEQELERVEHDREALARLVEELEGQTRRKRQFAAHVVYLLAEREPSLLTGFVDELVDALYRPEAQTRWEVLDALTLLVPVSREGLDGALDGAEAALFDEDSATLRLSAFRFLTAWGACDKDASLQVWPAVDEAVQCYHGDLEYRDMLGCLLAFAGGAIDASVAEQLAARLRFDAENGKGNYLKARSAEIYHLLVERFALENPEAKRSRKAGGEEDDEQ